MRFAWIAGRFLLVGLVLAATLSSLGFDYSIFNSVLGIDDSNASIKSIQDGSERGKQEDLVKDWEKPDVVLFITGRQHGYIEPCGCVTLARQKGGMMRRHRVQKILKERGWDVVSLDAGNQVRRFGQQPVIKLRKTYEGLCRVMEYDLIGLGPDDLKLPANNLVQTMINASGSNNPFTCSNVEVLSDSLTEKFKVIEKNGKRIGVTMVIGDEHIPGLRDRNGLTVRSAEDGLSDVVPKMEAAKCDMKVLIAFSSLEHCRDLARKFPTFDVLVTAGGAGDPTLEPEVIEAAGHVTSMIQVGVKGMYVGLIGMYQRDGRSEIKYKRVELDDRYIDTPEIKDIFKSYQVELKHLWETGDLKDIAPRNHPSGRKFVGSSSCADCHDEEYAIWEDGIDGDGGPHEKAMRSLEKNPNDDRVWVQRDFDPECVSCHATGWNPQNFYPYKSGYQNVDDTELFGNGCENCHGPGSAHVDLEEQIAKGQQVDPAIITKLRSEMVLTLADARANACKECHDLDNSPDFLLEGGFDEYWPKIEHGGE